MLGKLIKHEWKATWKLPVLLCLFVILMTVIGCVSFYYIGIGDIESSKTMALYTYIMVLLFIFNIMILSVASIVILIYFSHRFYKNLFTDEGYLVHTLPVTPAQIIISKGVCATIWSIIVSFLTLIGMVALIFSLINSILSATDSGSMDMLFRELKNVLPEIRIIFKQYAGFSLFTGVLLFILLYILGSISGFLLPYMCLSLGQMCKKHRVAAAVGFYFASFFAIQLVTSLISMPFYIKQIFTISYNVNDDLDVIMGPAFSVFPTYIISIIVSIALSIICYCVTRYVIGKKLNLE